MSVRRLAPKEIQPDSFAFTAENETWVAEQIAKYPAGRQASAVLPLLWRAQEQAGGWVPQAAIEHVARKLDMATIRVMEIATFYTMFSLEPVGKYFIQLCGTTPCALRGAEAIKNVLRARIGDQHHVTPDGNFSWLEVECLGACCNAPMVQINQDYYEDLTPEGMGKLMDDLAAGKTVKLGPQNERHSSEPEGGALTLTEASLYDGSMIGAWQKRFEEEKAKQAAATAAAAPGATTPATGAPKPAAAAAPPPAAAPGATTPAADAPKPAAAAAAGAPSAAAAPSATAAATGAPDPAATTAAPATPAVSKPATPPAASANPAPTTPGSPDTDKMGVLQPSGPSTPAKPSAGDTKNKPAALPKATNVSGGNAPAGEAPATASVPGPATVSGESPDAEAAAPKKGAAQKTAVPGAAPAPAAESAVSDEHKPELLTAARSGGADDLKLIWGVGPKLAEMLNRMGVFHFDQIAGWTETNLKWVDQNLGTFKGRAVRDDWIGQSKKLASGWRPEHAVGDKPTSRT